LNTTGDGGAVYGAASLDDVQGELLMLRVCACACVTCHTHTYLYVSPAYVHLMSSASFAEMFQHLRELLAPGDDADDGTNVHEWAPGGDDGDDPERPPVDESGARVRDGSAAPLHDCNQRVRYRNWTYELQANTEESVTLKAEVADAYFGNQYVFEVLQLLRRLLRLELAPSTQQVHLGAISKGDVLRAFFTNEFVGALLQLLNENLACVGVASGATPAPTSASELYVFLDVYMRCCVLRCSPTLLYEGKWPGSTGSAVDAEKMPRERFMALLRALDPAAQGRLALARIAMCAATPLT
jgi:hypothetical protein